MARAASPLTHAEGKNGGSRPSAPAEGRLKSLARMLGMAHVKKALTPLLIFRHSLRHYAPLLQGAAFSEKCLSHERELWADIYISHDVLPLPTAHMLAQRNNARVICDGIETPWLDKRLLPLQWGEVSAESARLNTRMLLPLCSHIFAAGGALRQKEYEEFNVPVITLPNYRNKEIVHANDRLRALCGVPRDARLALCISTVTAGLEPIIEAMNLLPPDVHLVTLGKLTPPTYAKAILNQAKRRGPKGRIHLFGMLPYHELASTAAGADVGIIALNPANWNTYHSLPNRVFDYLAAGLPFCTPDIPDIANLVTRYDVGRVLKDPSPEAWAKGMLDILEKRDELSKKTRQAATELTWESQEPLLLEAMGNAKKVTFLGHRDLGKNQRVLRMAATLTRNGIEVAVAYRGKERPPAIPQGAAFYPLGNCCAW